jgi:hypothetical protein
VDAFHASALAAGYADNGAPGERAVYHPGYYGAFVLDPEGLNVEVVNHNRGRAVGRSSHLVSSFFTRPERMVGQTLTHGS